MQSSSWTVCVRNAAAGTMRARRTGVRVGVGACSRCGIKPVGATPVSASARRRSTAVKRSGRCHRSQQSRATPTTRLLSPSSLPHILYRRTHAAVRASNRRLLVVEKLPPAQRAGGGAARSARLRGAARYGAPRAVRWRRVVRTCRTARRGTTCQRTCHPTAPACVTRRGASPSHNNGRGRRGPLQPDGPSAAARRPWRRQRRQLPLKGVSINGSN